MTHKARVTTALILIAAVGVGAAFLLWPSPSGQVEPSQKHPVPASPSPPEPPDGEVLTDWSTPLTPSCGDVLDRSDLDSAVGFTDPPPRLSPEDSFPVTLRNTAGAPITADVDRYDFAVPVLTDPTGEVIAMGDLTPVLAEGYSIVAIGPGEELTASGSLKWVTLCGEEVGVWEEPAPLPDGRYEMYLFAATGPFGEQDEAEQIQGGPFPITIDASASHEVRFSEVGGGSELPQCGQQWRGVPGDAPGSVTLTTTALGEVVAEGMTTLSGQFSLPEPVSGVNLYTDLLILDGDRVVGPLPHASDNLIGWYASAHLGDEVFGELAPVTCDGQALPPGEYEVVLTVKTIGTDAPTLAVSDPLPFTVGR